MGQMYQDPETDERMIQLFQADREEKLREMMEDHKKNMEKEGKELVSEVTGETLEEVKEQLREEFKKQLYGKDNLFGK